MSNIRPKVRAAIQTFLKSQEGENIPIDVLRAIQEEAHLMKETHELMDMLVSDPFEHLGDVKPKVERLKHLMQVTECERVRTGEDYASTRAIVSFPSCNMELHFRYERRPEYDEVGKGCHVYYSIGMCQNHGTQERLLEVQVFAPSIVPSAEPPVCVREELLAAQDGDSDEGGWEDMDDDEASPDAKRQKCSDEEDCCDDSDCHKQGKSSCRKDKMDCSDGECCKKEHGHAGCNKSKADGGCCGDSGAGDCCGGGSEMEGATRTTHDSYVAFLDPDVMHTFLDAAKLLPIEDDTAFFLLMTFPYYEHEWDIVGLLLEQVFGDESDDEESDEEN